VSHSWAQTDAEAVSSITVRKFSSFEMDENARASEIVGSEPIKAIT
jgi:hypothetical protein